jgi:hypothetical protein
VVIGNLVLTVDLILSLSKGEVVAGSVAAISWFDKLTMRSRMEGCPIWAD